MALQEGVMIKQNYLTIPSPTGSRKLAWTEWGEAGSPPVVCLHGLTRNSRDFDYLATELSVEYRVICPDMAGRGRSDWLEAPVDYNTQTYVMDSIALINQLGYDKVILIGTSMGGIIGMTLAAMPETPVSRLIINDIGPYIPKLAVERIAAYMTSPLPEFNSLDEIDRYLRFIHMPFGPLSDQQWHHLAVHSSITDETEKYKLHYDPAIGDNMKIEPDKAVEDVDLSALWEAITCPVLTIRGAESDLLLEQTAEQMKTTGPKSTLVTFDGIGHAPMLMEKEQISEITDWLKNRLA